MPVESMTNHDTADTMFIDGLGVFHAQRHKELEQHCLMGLYCFKKQHAFRNANVDLIVYPNRDGSWPSEAQRAEYASRFHCFEAMVLAALKKLPSLLSRVCRKYKIDISHLDPSAIIDGVEWHNVKIERELIECYTSNSAVADVHFTTVLQFSPDIVLTKVYFDG
jgi:hypothetical protein